MLNNLKVLKRDGLKQTFDKQRLFIVVQKAADAANQKIENLEELVGKILAKFEGKEEVSVDDIQNSVEHTLMVSKYKETAKKYIEYRHERDLIRNKNHSLFKAIDGIIEQNNPHILKENANLDSKTLTTQRTLMAGELSKYLAKDLLSKDVYEAHMDGDIHFHDMNFSPVLPYVNCCLVDLTNMLEGGFILGSAHIGSPKGIGVATAVTAQIIAQVSSANYGGTTIANIDQVLSKYVRMSYEKHLEKGLKYGIPDVKTYAKDLTEKETYDAFQALEYEINSLFNSHSQSPFTTVSFGMGVSWEERLIQQSILKVRLEGLGEEKVTAIFPKLIFLIDDGLNLKKTDPNYDIKQLALKCASVRLFPDIISVKNNKLLTGSSVPVASMGCRSFLSVWKDENGKEILDGRQNLGVVSINIPRIAIESNGDINKFWEILDMRCELAHKALIERMSVLKDLTAEAAPALYQQGVFGKRLKPSDKPWDELFKNNKASVSLGYLGIHETVCMLLNINKVLHNKEAETLGIDICKFLKAKTDMWKKTENIGYSLYSTPSENLCDRFLRLDRRKYGIIENVTDKDFYQNSFHLDVREGATPFEKILYEAPYHFIATGGHISYCEFNGDIRNNLKALESVWDFAVEHLNYFGTNVPSNRCFECGHDGDMKVNEDEDWYCPKCGNKDKEKLSIVLRITGYLGEVNQRPVNHGKLMEMVRRVKHE